jgi:hypothetical protein
VRTASNATHCLRCPCCLQRSGLHLQRQTKVLSQLPLLLLLLRL